MFEKLVFVEGVSDEDVIREWAATLECNLSRASVGFITLGGSRNIRHFAAQRTMDFLQKRGVELWFLLDRDESSLDDVERLRKQLGTNCNVRVLPVREIENYLAKPKALTEFISETRQRSGSQVSSSIQSAAEMTALIEQSAQKLRTFSLMKTVLRECNAPTYVNPIIRPTDDEDEGVRLLTVELEEQSLNLKNRAECLGKRLPEIRERFDAAWSHDKLAVVPGDELLNEVLKHFGLSFQKARDAKRIAALMGKTEIPIEIQTILAEIVAVH